MTKITNNQQHISCTLTRIKLPGTRIRWQNTMQNIRTKSTSIEKKVFPPTQEQLRNHFVSNALPMVGFGFMDQTVLIQAGNMIDCTLGVTMGLSTLTAAAVGGICSNASGVLFGGTLDSLARAAGLPGSNLSPSQRALPKVKRLRLGANLAGILVGCMIGMINLLFIDTERSASLKLLSMNDEHEYAFDIEVSNALRQGATTIIVRGPDVDGLLASITSALNTFECSLLEVSAINSGEEGTIEDKFVIVNSKTKEAIDDDKLEDLANVILDATRSLPPALKAHILELEEKVKKLERNLQRRQTIVRRQSHRFCDGDNRR